MARRFMVVVVGVIVAEGVLYVGHIQALAYQMGEERKGDIFEI